MIQKILKIGSSIGITIPKKTAQDIGISAGDMVELTFNKERKRLILEPLISIDQELVAWTKEFIKKYRPALDALAKK